MTTAESERLHSDKQRNQNWKRWGAYLSERQWGTVREDYSPDASCWDYFSYEDAAKRTYRWGEDGLLGFTDRQCRLCFAPSLWNGKDPLIKERLFGLTGPQGNHGEDVKESYFYLKSLPTYSYCAAAYQYPLSEYPYDDLVKVNQSRSRKEPEFEIFDTDAFKGNRFIDLSVEYAKASPNDILIRFVLKNFSESAEELWFMPQLWFRNTWSWGRTGEGYTSKPSMRLSDEVNQIETRHPTLGEFIFEIDPAQKTELLFTENVTNFDALFGWENPSPHTKDAFHRYVCQGEVGAVNPGQVGTKLGALQKLRFEPKESKVLRYRLYDFHERKSESFGDSFNRIFADRLQEYEEFYRQQIPQNVSVDDRLIAEQAYAGLLWTKQFYYYSVREWEEGDPTQPEPAADRAGRRNSGWQHLYNRDVISMPDSWEYPWYAAWDLAFHALAFVRVDPEFAKKQLILLLREWYMHPNGQIPAYEFAFSDVNPPVHAWACWRLYKMEAEAGNRDREFLARVFHKLLLNFTWWVNRKDITGNNLFTGGFLGLDNIGVFDRSAPLPFDGVLEQSDATAWMAFYCGTMLSISLELATYDRSYSDVASKFFEHFIAIVDAMNSAGGSGLWDEEDSFYYDMLSLKGESKRLKVRSLVGIMPLIAVEVLQDKVVDALPGFKRRTQWLLRNRADLARYIPYMVHAGPEKTGKSLLAVPSADRLRRMLHFILSEDEFLSPYGVRSLSKYHRENPYVFQNENLLEGDKDYRIAYDPAESTSEMFGGNSNWRGPVWFPTNYLIIEALERYHHFYGESFQIEFPTGSGKKMNLKEVSIALAERLVGLFGQNGDGRRVYLGERPFLPNENEFRNRILFHEYFHGDDGTGLGASHQTGWTALVSLLIEKICRYRSEKSR